MQFIKPDINLDFIGKRKAATIFSIVLIVIGLASLLAKGGPEYGIDFAGGTLIQVKFVEKTTAADIKDALSVLEMGNLTVQQFGDEANEFLVRTPQSSAKIEGIGKRIGTSLTSKYGENQVDIRRVEMVGPQVGKDLREKGKMAVVYAMIAILCYVSWRFEFRFAVGAIVALIHDILITLGVFSLFGKEIDLPVVAAFLAIIGYSLNDTIIVYDRIRENMGKHGKLGFPNIVNRSINETLSRTILTSSTTLMVVMALFVLGGGVIHNFAFALLIGVAIGTYSSVFIASPVLLYWDTIKAKRTK